MVDNLGEKVDKCPLNRSIACIQLGRRKLSVIRSSRVAECSLFRACLSIEVNERAVGTFIVGVRYSGVSVKRGSTVQSCLMYTLKGLVSLSFLVPEPLPDSSHDEISPFTPLAREKRIGLLRTYPVCVCDSLIPAPRNGMYVGVGHGTLFYCGRGMECFHHVITIPYTRNKPPSWCMTCIVCY